MDRNVLAVGPDLSRLTVLARSSVDGADSSIPSGRDFLARLTVAAVVALVLLSAAPLAAQTATLRGVVTDSTSSLALENVRVELATASGTVQAAVLSGRDGRFTFSAAEGTYRLVLTRFGYEELRVTGVRLEAGGSEISVAMSAATLLIDPVTVTVGRVGQAAMRSPTAITVVGVERVRLQSGLSGADVVRHMPGVNVNTMGLAQYTYNTRASAGTGFGGARTMVDFRFLASPSTSQTGSLSLSVSSLDVDRVEMVRGPTTALHGPGASEGLIHIITRSAFDEGTTVALTAGTRSLLQPAFRHAQRISERLAFKVTGEYLRGDDWEYVDPAEAANRASALAAGADPDTLLIGARDPALETFRGVAGLEWRPSERTTLFASAGRSQVANATYVPEGIGGVQLRDWSVTHAQARLSSGELFANVFFGKNDSGRSYALRQGTPQREYSWNLIGQLQHGSRFDFGDGVDVRYGVDFEQTRPDTRGTYHGRYESRDDHSRFGAFVSFSQALTADLDLFGAFRFDAHSKLDGGAYAPMAALVYRPLPQHSLRLTATRAFNEPLSVLLFPDQLLQTFGPYGVRFTAVPHTEGFRFRRDCGGLCMRSPFNPGGGSQFLATDATLVWAGLVQAMLAAGVDLTGIPAPTADQVGSLLSLPPNSVQDLQPLSHNYVKSLEVGYKGLVADRVFLSVDVNRSTFLGASGLRVITPTVTLEESSLAAYLGTFMPQAQADAVAAGMSTIPGGVVTPENALDPYDIIVAYGPTGEAQPVFWTAEFSGEFELGAGWTLGGSYTWANTPDDVSGIARNRSASVGAYRIGYEGPRVAGQLQGRSVESFTFSSGLLDGLIPGYTVLDASVEWPLPWKDGASLSVITTNLLNNEHIELIGMPEIGRMIMMRLRLDL